MSMFVKKGDTVVVIAGKDNGKQGTVQAVSPKLNKVIVEGVNIVSKCPLETPQSYGFVKFDSVYIDAPLLGTQMRLVDDKVNIDDSRIKFNDFSIYAKKKMFLKKKEQLLFLIKYI